jgi:VWFA-related protein
VRGTGPPPEASSKDFEGSSEVLKSRLEKNRLTPKSSGRDGREGRLGPKRLDSHLEKREDYDPMSVLRFLIKLHLLGAVSCTCLGVTSAQDQKRNIPPNQSTPEPEEEIIRSSTNLIQTGVAVFDKKGQFVINLKREDFELSVDGKPVSISFFEQNTFRQAADDESKTAWDSLGSGTSNNAPAKPAGRGRNIIFVVDDLHLSFDSHYRIRKLILKFIDQEMMPEDTIAIVSSTGKIGFLQQFSSDKTVLRAAVERLIFSRDRSANDRAIPPMTEYEALLVSQWDRDVTDIFAAQELGADLESRRETVRSRARTILTRAAVINRGTYSTLEQTIRNSAQLPGRKVVFLISDGFLLDPANTDSSYLMRRITDAAARTNAVIYSFDAKGLEAGFPEGTTGATAVAFRVQAGGRFEAQDGLALLADETGGRFIHNTNDLQRGLTKSIDEASQYYLLAWQPVSANGKSEQLRKITVSVRNHPELKVRVHGGYLDKKLRAESDEKSKAKNRKGKATLSIPVEELNAAARAPVPLRMLPTSLTVNYAEIPNEGFLVAVASQIESDAIEFIQEGDKAKANIDLLGIVYDSSGKREGFFRERLTVDASVSALSKPQRQDIFHNYQTKLKPGLYQVRVAARDVKSGRVGSAVQWIEIPDLSKRRLALSSLILSERANDGKTTPAHDVTNIGAASLPAPVDRRFARTSELRYIVFIYNALPGKTGTARPDVTLQTQILRGNDVVVTSPLSPISIEGQDPTRLSYAADIPLNTLPAGRYELLVLVNDRIAKSSSAQRVSFEVK